MGSKNRRILPRERKSNEMKSLINEYKYGNVNRRKGTGFNSIQLKYPRFINGNEQNDVNLRKIQTDAAYQ